jgi:hypothetical protein
MMVTIGRRNHRRACAEEFTDASANRAWAGLQPALALADVALPACLVEIEKIVERVCCVPPASFAV